MSCMKHKYCIYCGSAINNERAIFCSFCGKKIGENSSVDFDYNSGTENNNFNNMVKNGDGSNSNIENFDIKYEKNVWIAFFLSLMGWGQYYNGQILKAVIFAFIFAMFNTILSIEHESLIIDIIAISFLIFYIYTIIDAYHNAKFINEYNGNYFYNENPKKGDFEDLENPKDFREKFHKMDAEFSAKFHRYNKFKHRKDLRDGKIILTGIGFNLLFRILGAFILVGLSIIFGFNL